MTGNNTESLSNIRLSLCIHTFAVIIDLLFRQASRRQARPADPRCTARPTGARILENLKRGFVSTSSSRVVPMLRPQAMGRDIFNIVDAKILPV